MSPETSKMIYKEGKINLLAREYPNVFEANKKACDLEEQGNLVIVERRKGGSGVVYHRPRERWTDSEPTQ